MMVELRDGSTDFIKLQRVTRPLVANASAQDSLQHVGTSFRAQVPELRVTVDRLRGRGSGEAPNPEFPGGDK